MAKTGSRLDLSKIKDASISDRLLSMEDYNLRKATNSSCKCIPIDPEKGMTPDNLLCNVEGVQGYLSDHLERMFCFHKYDEGVKEDWDKLKSKLSDMDKDELNDAVENPEDSAPEKLVDHFDKMTIKIEESRKEDDIGMKNFRKHMDRMKNDVSILWSDCLKSRGGKLKTRESLWECISEVSKDVNSLYGHTKDELEDKGGELGLDLSGKNKPQQIRLLQKTKKYDPNKDYYRGDMVSADGTVYVVTGRGKTSSEPDESEDDWEKF